MPRTNGADWKAWHAARLGFRLHDTAGFTQDMAFLEAHIKELANVAPKDAAGWPVGTALRTINKLQKDYDHFKAYLTNLPG